MNPEVGSRTGNIIRKGGAVTLIGLLSVSAAACSTGRGRAIKNCGGHDSTDIRVTWGDDPGYVTNLDPVVLQEYATDSRVPGGLDIYDQTSGDLHHDDKLDKLGEFVCISDPNSEHPGVDVLTYDGARMREACMEEGIPQYTDEPPVKQYCPS